ncbi:MAG TPA: AraC family transcriptional regulator [Flavisolibacter sp.]|nr:AraC family transcriptional regulator [Flavisolibacter sp.]
MATVQKLLIKNMVCQRCILTVSNIFNTLTIPIESVTLGEVVLSRKLETNEYDQVIKELRAVGFEVIEARVKKIIEDIKQALAEYLNLGIESQNHKLSAFIASKVPYEFSYLSDLFSSVEGQTIERYFILQRIEKVKELLVYDHLSLSQISYQTGFSSVHHLSAQFKKITGLTPSHYKTIGEERRNSLDIV